MFTKLPEDLGSLDLDGLRALRDTLKGEIEANKGKVRTPDQLAEFEQALADLKTVRETISNASKALATDVGDDEDEVDDEEEAADETEEVDDEAADDTDDVEEPAKEAAAKPPAKVRTGLGVASKADETKDSGRVSPDKVLAFDGTSTEAGEAFASWGDVASALIDKAKVVRHNTPERFPIGQVRANYGPERQLDANPLFNLHLFDEAELTAALCTAPEPSYEMACWNTTRRPVFNRLPRYQPNRRGSVSIYPSPSLHDITTGYDQWTFDDDDNPSAEKECATIVCGDPEVYEMYAVYRCMTIKHNMLMTFPELVEAWLNRLFAATSRFAEKLILETMGTTANQLDVNHGLGYNATTSITSGLLNYLAMYQEEERWDTPNMLMFAPRWLQLALKADMMRRRSTNGSRIMVPSDADVNALFTGVGFEPVWFIDTPSWATAIPSKNVNGVLGQFPANLEVLLAPVGKYAVLDRGELNIGVTGNNYYRDTTNLKKNEITFFVENYEGVVDTTSCPADIVQFPNVCFNGQQIADIVINCQGGDEVGAAS